MFVRSSVITHVLVRRSQQRRNFGLKSEGEQIKFLTWCTYKWGVRPPTPKKWGSGPRPP